MLLIDTTYWRRSFGVVVFKDISTKKFIWWKFIDAQERSIDYADGLLWCRLQGYIIKGIVSDGMSGILKVVGSIPLQICQAHIQRNIRKKLTNKPKNL